VPEAASFGRTRRGGDARRRVCSLRVTGHARIGLFPRNGANSLAVSGAVDDSPIFWIESLIS